MKRLFLFILPLLMLAACVETPSAEGQPSGKKAVNAWITIPEVPYADATKMTVDETDSTGLVFRWAYDDKVGVYPASVTGLSLFVLQSGGGTRFARFDGGGFALRDTALYYAFYPYDGNAIDKRGIPLDYTGQKAGVTGNTLSDKDYMAGSAISSDGVARFDFHHLGAFLRLDIDGLPAFEDVQCVDIVPLYGQIAASGRYDIIADSAYVTSMLRSHHVTTTLAAPIAKTLSLWTIMAPQDLSADSLAVFVTTGNGTYASGTEGRSFNRGKAYRLPLAMAPAVKDTACISVTETEQVMLDIRTGSYSGITYLGPNDDGTYRFALTDDNLPGGGLAILDVAIDDDGIADGGTARLTILPGTAAATGRPDNEGVAYDGTTLWVSAEGDQSIRQYDLDGYATGGVLSVPEDLDRDHIAGNGGFEALTWHSATATLWTTTEMPLDGDIPGLHRIQRFNNGQPVDRYLDLDDGATVADTKMAKAVAYVYGIPAMMALDDGRLLVLEREVYVPEEIALGWCRGKIYLVDPAEAVCGVLQKIPVAEFMTGCDGEMPLLANYEGMCLGPKIGGRQSIILINDSQDGMEKAFGFRVTHEYIKILFIDVPSGMSM